MGANNSFNPNPLRSTNNMADKACHVVGSTTQVGLTQALAVQENPTESATKISKASPWLCLVALAVIAATFLYNKLYIVAVFLAPLMGLLAFAGLIAYWRTGKMWIISSVPVIFIIVAISASDAGLFWAVPQSFAFALLFMALPVLLFRKQILRWLARVHS